MVVDLDIRPQDIDRIIEMAWEDRTPFDAIELQFGLKENGVRKIITSEIIILRILVVETIINYLKTIRSKF